MKKRSLVLILLLLIALALPLLASAETQSGSCGDNLTWTLTDAGALTISGSGEMYNFGEQEDENHNDITTAPWGSALTSVVIGDGVTSIGNYAFCGCKSLASVTGMNGVTSIGSGAFKNCHALTSINIPDSVTSIGNYTFFSCSSLTSVNIPDGVTSIEAYAFACCGLTSVIIPDSVESIGESAFSSCYMTSATIGNSVTSIGTYAFCYCSNLTEVTIGDGVTSIGDEAFKNCGLTSVNIPDSVTSIGARAFHACTSLASVTGMNGVTSIGDEAFKDCFALTSFTIPDSVESIGDYAFNDCENLTSITIPDSVERIGKDVFSGCNELTVYCPQGSTAAAYCTANNIPKALTGACGANGDNLTWTLTDAGALTISGSGEMYNFGEQEDENHNDITTAPWGSALTSVVIGDGVTSIGNYAFCGCKSLASVTGMNGVTSIGSGVFKDCHALTSINIPDSVTSIGNYTFYSCSSLTSVNIPDGVTSIGAYAFTCCGLTSVIIPDNVESIGENAFISCYSLVGVTIGNSVTSIDAFAFCYCSNLTEVTIGDGVTSIGDEAFKNCSLTSVNIPDSVTSIGVRAFHACTSLASVTGMNGVTSIGDEAFKDCWVLTSFTIPDSVESIGDYAFKDCENLTSFTIPDSVESIGKDVFSGCNELTVYCPPGSTAAAYCTANNIPKALTGACGANGANLTWTLTDSGVLTISGSGAMENYDNGGNTSPWGTTFTSVVFGDGVTSIGNYAFAGCSLMTSVNIPAGVTSIGDGAFYGCDLLTIITQNCTDYAFFYAETQNIAHTALHHDWDETTYTWNEENTEVTATRVCSHNADHVETETVSATSEITKQATCTEMGDTTYTSGAFENEAFEAQSKTLTNIDALGHDWGETTYTWNENNTKVTAARVCSHDAEHVETETVPAASEITKQPACTEMGDTTYTGGAFENEAFEAQSKTLTNIDALGHDWGEAAYAWADDNSTVTATRVCARNTAHKETETVSVTSEVTKQPTRTQMGETTYTAVFANAAFAKQAKTVADVPYQGAVVTVQPTDLTVNEGKTAAFTVTARNTDTYQWYYRKSASGAWNRVTINGTAATYNLTTIASHNGYQFRCLVENDIGFEYSDIVTLTVVAKPTVTAQPTDKTVNAGEAVTFTVQAAGATEYQWYYRKSASAAWNRVTINGTAATYHLTTIASHNGYKFRCLVKNSAGSAYSSTATLTVTNKPVITAQPANLTVKAGDTATFKVTATGDPTYQWYYRKPDSEAWNRVVNYGAENTYNLVTIVSHDGYQFRCLVRNDDGSVYSNTVTLTVTSKPVITVQPTDTTVNAGETAALKVTATNATTYQWYYRKSASTSDPWISVKNGGTSATYNLTTIASHNGYQFRCLVKNDSGSLYSNTVTLTVTNKPVITAQPSDITVNVPETATFKVTANNTTAYQWYYRKSASGAWNRVTINGTADTYNLTTIASHDGYQFRCLVKNDSASLYSNTVTLTVTNKPIITTQPSDTTVNVTETATFKVTAKNTTAYQWYYRKSATGVWNRVTINGTSNTYNLVTNASHDGYQFRCLVKNDSASLYSNTVTLTVTNKPVITTQPSDTTVNTGETAELKVTAKNATTYQWYYRKPAAETWNRVVYNGTAATYSLAANATHNGYQFRCLVKNDDGSLYTNVATLTVTAKPTITVQPTDKTVIAGETATFKVTAVRATSYQWYYRKTASSGWISVKNNGTSATYNLVTIAANNGYQFRCEAKNDEGTAISDIVNLTVK